MKQLILKNQFINRAKMLARVMTSTSDIRVTVSGNGAYRQPGIINIPAGDFTDPEWVAMVHGWIDHELGHEDETDFRVTQLAANESKLLNEFRQIFEDVRMEKSRGIKFKGARINLEKLTELAVKREIFQKPSQDCHPLTAVQFLCLYYGRSQIIQQHVLSPYADISKQLVEDKLGVKLMNDICSVIHKVEDAKDNGDSLLLAREVISLIQKELDKQKQNQNEPQDTPDTDPQDDEENSDSDQQDGDDEEHSDSDQQDGDDEESSDSDQQDGDDEENSDSDQQAGDDEEHSDSDQQAGDDNKRPAPKKPSSQDIIKALEQALNDEVDGIEDFHDALAQLLGEDAEEAKEEHPELQAMPNCQMVNTKKIRLNGSLDEMLAKRLSGGVFQTMHKVLFDQVSNLESARKTGSRIITSKIAGVPAGNLRVFQRRVEQQDISAAVSVIVDASGSMGNPVNGTITTMQYANTCAFAFATGLDKTGVAVEVSYFGLCDGVNFNSYIAKSFSSKAKVQNFKVLPDDTTPTGEMMMHALNSLVLRPEEKKLMIVLTDGAPNDASIVVKASQFANSVGIKIVPIGICTKVVAGFDEGEFVTVSDPSHLTLALRDAVKLKLFN